MDANDAASYVQELAGDEANIIFGAMYDDTYADEASITVIATGLDLSLIHILIQKASSISEVKMRNDAAYEKVMSSIDLEHVRDVAITQLGMVYALSLIHI